MELKNLITFKTIAEQKSFSNAARVLGYAQPTITFQIRQLEDELGVPLFDRIGNKIRLTESGNILLDYTFRILSLVDEAKCTLASDCTPSGILKISGISSICSGILPQLIKKYNSDFPDVLISASTATTPEVLDMVNSGASDLGLYMDFELPSEDTYIMFSIENPLYFICSKNNELSGRKAVSLKDLKGIPIIATEPDCCYRNILVSLFAKNDVVPSILFESENTEVIKRFVQSDIGIALLPEIAVHEELNNGTLCKINVTDAIPTAFIIAIHNKNQSLTPAIREFFTTISDLQK